MKISKVTVSNFRPYRKEQTVIFSTEKKKNITVIRANNNSGKTSLYEAIKWCLYGDPPEFEERDTIVNRHTYSILDEIGTFDVTVQIHFEDNNKKYVLRRIASINSDTDIKNPPNQALLSGVKADGGHHSSMDDFETKEFINRLLPKEISQYFIVDGDDFKKFTSPTSGQTKEAIEQLLKLKLLERSKEHLQKIRQQLKKKLLASGGVDSKDNSLDNEYNKLIDKRDKLDKKIKETEGEIATSNNKIKKYDDQLKNYDDSKKHLAEIKLNEGIKRQLQERKHEALTALSSNMRNAYLPLLKTPINKVISELEKKRKKKHFPKPWNEIYIKDLLQECKKNGHAECLCGNKFKEGDKHYKKLNDLLKETPPDSLTDIVSDLSVKLGDAYKKSKKVDIWVNSDSDKIGKLDIKIQDQRKIIEDLKSKLDKTAMQNAPALQRSRRDLNIYLDKIQTQNIRDKHDKGPLDERIKEIESKIDKIKNVDKRTKKLQFKEKLLEDSIKAIDEVFEDYAIDVRSQLSKEVSKIFLNILHAEGRYKKFTIDDHYDYNLLNAEGIKSKTMLSAAQRKILGFAFVAGLRKVAEEEAPFIIDSPVGVVDAKHRSNLAKTIPGIASQLILFTTDTEMTPEFHNRLKENISSEWEIEYDSKSNTSAFRNLRKN